MFSEYFKDILLYKCTTVETKTQFFFFVRIKEMYKVINYKRAQAQGLFSFYVSKKTFSTVHCYYRSIRSTVYSVLEAILV